jgi:hypothetical protein
VSLEGQVDKDFRSARRSALRRQVWARLRNDHTSNRTPSFEDIRKKLGASDA